MARPELTPVAPIDDAGLAAARQPGVRRRRARSTTPLPPRSKERR
ncbi:hypothetical protein [Amycolatopsis australiensis]|nr:hypothetical protein [Amycolatopsis australiensis]